MREDRKEVYFKLLNFLDALAFKRVFLLFCFVFLFSFLLSNVILTID